MSHVALPDRVEPLSAPEMAEINGGGGLAEAFKAAVKKAAEKAIDCVVENAAEAWRCFRAGLAPG